MSARPGFRFAAAGGLALILLLASCAVLDKGTEILNKADRVATDAQTVVKVANKFRSSFADITEEEEYYIGRSVAALILSRYRVYQNDALTQYLNTLGGAVALYSDRPEIFAGYHFLILDTAEVNAMAAPGGMIFVTKGLLRRCKDEETLALILAHEIGHVSAKHGLQAIKKSRLTDAFMYLGTTAVQRFGPQELAQLTTMFEGVLSDIVEQLVVRGYDRASEYDADAKAVWYGARVGYEPAALVRFLKTMVGDKTTAAGGGWFKTHPSPESRIDAANRDIVALGAAPPKIDAVRTKRFAQYIGLLR
jgi:beta-barrel assembly-enhancing protease